MNLGIALLLRGSSADLSAALHSIELARRTTGVVHAVFLEQGQQGQKTDPGEEGKTVKQGWKGQLAALAGLFGDAEEVTVHIHLLESLADEPLLRFLCEYRIFCLILGAGDQSSVKRKTAWLKRLRRRLSGRRDCFLPPLWSVIIKPRDEAAPP
ncbi:hypothetical protein ACUUL3_14155 [Thiovibrio sp. JS02]